MARQLLRVEESRGERAENCDRVESDLRDSDDSCIMDGEGRARERIAKEPAAIVRFDKSPEWERNRRSEWRGFDRLGTKSHSLEKGKKKRAKNEAEDYYPR